MIHLEANRSLSGLQDAAKNQSKVHNYGTDKTTGHPSSKFELGNSIKASTAMINDEN